jgi:hypothetical protein
MRPPDQVKRYVDLFKRAELAIIDSGHIMVVQAPDARRCGHSFSTSDGRKQ